ncbi:unnamed protein product [Gemmata massiliana]|uniref:Uncharacterized protein n=1 Tax=Gemmata massiliana TaxID=1210884 RepID=A0A6P2CW15_9BACT|nr:unnamed protein product [Gemmata massiliana]
MSTSVPTRRSVRTLTAAIEIRHVPQGSPYSPPRWDRGAGVAHGPLPNARSVRYGRFHRSHAPYLYGCICRTHGDGAPRGRGGAAPGPAGQATARSEVARTGRENGRVRDRGIGSVGPGRDHARVRTMQTRAPHGARERAPGQGEASRGGLRYRPEAHLRLRELRPAPRRSRRGCHLHRAAQQHARRIYDPRAQGGQARAVRKTNGDELDRLQGDDRRSQGSETEVDDRVPAPLRAVQPDRDEAVCRQNHWCRAHHSGDQLPSHKSTEHPAQQDARGADRSGTWASTA